MFVLSVHMLVFVLQEGRGWKKIVVESGKDKMMYLE
jgi:hypothetical protein